LNLFVFEIAEHAVAVEGALDIADSCILVAFLLLFIAFSVLAAVCFALIAFLCTIWFALPGNVLLAFDAPEYYIKAWTMRRMQSGTNRVFPIFLIIFIVSFPTLDFGLQARNFLFKQFNISLLKSLGRFYLRFGLQGFVVSTSVNYWRGWQG
jgi:hypothetical protein